MRHVLTSLILVCSLTAGFLAERAAAGEAEPAAAEESEWSFAFDVTANSKYVWRGINLVHAPVLQPSAAVSYGGWTFAVWGNMETINANRYGGHGKANGKFTEIDLTLDYSWGWEKFNLSAGVIHYMFPNTGFNSTTEIYGAVGYDCLLEPTITIYHDIDEASGTYITFGLSHTFEDVWKPTAGTSMDIELGGTVGWGSSSHNSFYYGASNSGLADLTLSVAAPIDLGKGWTLKPLRLQTSLLNGATDAERHTKRGQVGVGTDRPCPRLGGACASGGAASPHEAIGACQRPAYHG